MSKKHKIEGRYITLQHSVMECPAWIALSHGARTLFLALKKRLPGGNKSYISTREAARELKSSRQKIREWFAELEHYGFIAEDTPHCLGVDGVGKATRWKIADTGTTSKTSLTGIWERPSEEYLKWDGTAFDPRPYRRKAEWEDEKIKPRASRDDHPGPDVRTTPGPDVYPPNGRGGQHGVAIERSRGGQHGVPITRLATRRQPEALLGSLEPSETIVAQNDPRVVALDATEKRLRAKRSPQ
jgi:hypothetical protein